jgi:hypothetical protein
VRHVLGDRIGGFVERMLGGPMYVLVYLLAGLGATLEQSVFPSGEITVAPTIPIGVGARVYLNPNTALRVELRDNLMVENRVQSGTWAFKQNAAFSVGLAFFGAAKK